MAFGTSAHQAKHCLCVPIEQLEANRNELKLTTTDQLELGRQREASLKLTTST